MNSDPIPSVVDVLEEDEIFMTSLELMTTRLTALGINFDDPRVVTIGKVFQASNHP